MSNCNNPDQYGAPCGKCRPCIAVEVKTELRNVCDAIEADLLEIRHRDMGREANMMLNEALLVVVKHRGQK